MFIRRFLTLRNYLEVLPLFIYILPLNARLVSLVKNMCQTKAALTLHRVINSLRERILIKT